MILQPKVIEPRRVPPIVCCWCGDEFEHEHRCIYEARKAGWLVCSTTVKVKQTDGSRRDEFLGECPKCQKEKKDIEADL